MKKALLRVAAFVATTLQAAETPKEELAINLHTLPPEIQMRIAHFVQTPAPKENLQQRMCNSQALNLVNKSLKNAQLVVPFVKLNKKQYIDLTKQWNVDSTVVFALCSTELYLAEESLKSSKNTGIRYSLASKILLTEARLMHPRDCDLIPRAQAGDKNIANCLKRLFATDDSSFYEAYQNKYTSGYTFGDGYESLIYLPKYGELITFLIEHQYAKTLEILLD